MAEPERLTAPSQEEVLGQLLQRLLLERLSQQDASLTPKTGIDPLLDNPVSPLLQELMRLLEQQQPTPRIDPGAQAPVPRTREA